MTIETINHTGVYDDSAGPAPAKPTPDPPSRPVFRRTRVGDRAGSIRGAVGTHGARRSAPGSRSRGSWPRWGPSETATRGRGSAGLSGPGHRDHRTDLGNRRRGGHCTPRPIAVHGSALVRRGGALIHECDFVRAPAEPGLAAMTLVSATRRAARGSGVLTDSRCAGNLHPGQRVELRLHLGKRGAAHGARQGWQERTARRVGQCK